MKYFIFITILLTILSVFFIATPIEAANVTLEAGFPVTISKESKKEFSNTVKAQILKNVNFKKLSVSKVKGLKKIVSKSINLESFVNTNTNATSLVELQAIFQSVTQTILNSTTTAVIGSGITNPSVQFTTIIDGIGKNVNATVKAKLVIKIESLSCNNTEASCKKIVADITKKIL